MSAASSAPDLAHTLAAIFGGLRALLAARMHRPTTIGARDAWPLFMLLHRRLGRMTSHFAALAERVAAGKFVPPTPKAGRVSQPGRPARPPARRLPGRAAWLCVLIPHEAAGIGSQLEALLAGPDMRALLVTCPQAARMLRSLSKMLGLPDAAVPRPPPRPTSPPQPSPQPWPPQPWPPETGRACSAASRDATGFAFAEDTDPAMKTA